MFLYLRQFDTYTTSRNINKSTIFINEVLYEKSKNRQQ